MACGDCHGSPPKNHYAGACTACHSEADARGTSLRDRRLHMNGKVDLGDGSGTCGACHGNGNDPTPLDAAHVAHARPTSAAPVPCETCHEVPASTVGHPTGNGVTVRFRGRAVTGGRRASWSPTTKTCAGTYCHEGAGATLPAPTWSTGPSARACTACHGSPPPAPHPASTSCGSSGCHDGLVGADGSFTAAGRAAHVNGTLRP